MKARRSLWKLALALALLALLGGVASCGKKAAAAPPQAWIDSPADGATLPPGSPVPVVCRASAPKGVAEVLLSVDGAPYRSVPVAEAAGSCAVTIEWLPGEPGFYTLQVTAYDSTGTGSTPATAIVKVEGATSGPPAETPALAATATATVDAGPTPAVATATPAPTAEPTAAPSPTPLPPHEVSCTEEQDTVEAGRCTVLHWSVEYVTAVYLDGEGVVGQGSREVCPPETTTYNLHVEAPGGNVDRSVTITVVAPPPDTTPPPVPALRAPMAGQTILSSVCPAVVTLQWSPVTDASGVFYEVLVKAKVGSTWQTVREWDSLDTTVIPIALECGREYMWGVRARDGAGNLSAWAQADFGVASP